MKKFPIWHFIAKFAQVVQQICQIPHELTGNCLVCLHDFLWRSRSESDNEWTCLQRLSCLNKWQCFKRLECVNVYVYPPIKANTQDKPLIHFLVEHFQRKTHQQLDDLKSKHFKEACLSFSKSKHILEREKHYQI